MFSEKNTGWADDAQQELVDSVKRNLQPGRLLVVQIARRCGNTTVLNKIRAQVPGITAFYDRGETIDFSILKRGGTIVAVSLTHEDFYEHATAVSADASRTANANTEFLYRIVVMQGKK